MYAVIAAFTPRRRGATPPAIAGAKYFGRAGA